MGLLDYFKPVQTWSAEQVRQYLDTHRPQDYNLVDVRQPGEYREGHLPGAQLIPVKELEGRLGELDPGKQTITYCAAGVRSRAGTSILQNAGFEKVVSMSGGIHGWKGMVAEGELELNRAWFSTARSPEDYIGLSWLLEDGTRQFYAELEKTAENDDFKSFFRELVTAEEQHKSSLRTLYQGLHENHSHRKFPEAVVSELPPRTMLEGGVPLTEALQWVEGKSLHQVLQLAVALEANAYDRYLLMRREAGDEQSRSIFNHLAEEEKIHLQLLSDRLDRILENPV
ncbi:MAG: rhodanese-like domain-containing protein [Syntrophotaleaceae bacterium]